MHRLMKKSCILGHPSGHRERSTSFSMSVADPQKWCYIFISNLPDGPFPESKHCLDIVST